MPPAFNLSQDQTLQFDLENYCSKEIEETLQLHVRAFETPKQAQHLRTEPKDSTLLCETPTSPRTRTPTLIGCMFLKSLTTFTSQTAPRHPATTVCFDSLCLSAKNRILSSG